jgi:hypothetical protein
VAGAWGWGPHACGHVGACMMAGVLTAPSRAVPPPCRRRCTTPTSCGCCSSVRRSVGPPALWPPASPPLPATPAAALATQPLCSPFPLPPAFALPPAAQARHRRAGLQGRPDFCGGARRHHRVQARAPLR